MKKMFVLLLVAMICGSQMIFSQDVVVGTVRTDGFQKITKGAFWSKRPESKMIYDGSYPPGFKVYDLESDYFVRFVDEEHNQDDKNYIVFPKGEKVYVDQKGQYFAAICGNKIEFLKPVDMVSITSTSSSNSGSCKKDTVYVEREKQEVSNCSEKPEREERNNGNTYYINNASPYGYYGVGYYYGYYGGAYCYRYYDGPVYHFNGGNNYCNNLPTGSNYNYTGNNHNFTGDNNRPTGHGGMSTGRGNGNTNTTVNHGGMSTGRGNGNTNTGGSGNTNGGRSSVSSYSNSSNVSVGRSNVPSSSNYGNVGGGRGNSFSSGGSPSRNSGNGNGGGGRR